MEGNNGQSSSSAKEIFYKDFLPSPVPSRSSCCTRAFKTFSEIVEEVNNWLRNKEKIEVINCEVISANMFDKFNVIIKDSWPNTRYLRGLRLWWKNTTTEISQQDALAKRRFLLGFRDFLPNVDRKSIFSGQFENAHEILTRINSYIASKATPVKVLALQTLDVPYEGYIDINADTDENQVAISQHGFTRFVRILRIFLLTQYPKLQRIQSAAVRTLPQLDIKDFTSKPEDEEGIPSIISRAMAWCSNENDVALLNIQVLESRAGTIDTASSTWTMESPGHIPNKFSSFVRVVFMSSSVKTCGVTSVVVDILTKKEKALTENKDNDKEVTNMNEKNRKESAISRSSKQFVVTPCHKRNNDDDPVNGVINDVVNDVANNKERPESGTSQDSTKIITVQPKGDENKYSYNSMNQNNRRQSSVSRSSSKLIIVKSTNGNVISDNEEGMDVININDKEDNNMGCNNQNKEENDKKSANEKTEIQNGGTTVPSQDDLDDEEAEALSIIPDYDEIRNRNLISKSFYPMIVSEGGLCSETQYESMKVVVNKINVWISAVKGIPVQIQTQFQYFKGNNPDMNKNHWVKYMSGGSWAPICHVVVEAESL